jgi:hypothetical protein
MVSKAPALLVPATPMPMTPKIGSIIGYDNEMSDTNFDEALTTGAHVFLARLIRLDRMHHMTVEAILRSRCILAVATGGSCHGGEGRRKMANLLVLDCCHLPPFRAVA